MLKFFKKNKFIEIVAPITGDIVPIEEVQIKYFHKR